MMNKKQNLESQANSSRRDALKTIGLGIGTGALLNMLSACKDQKATNTTSSQLTNPVYYASATAIAKAIRNKEISSEEITKAYIKRIKEVNPKINAVVQLAAKEALASAKEADKALAKGENIGLLHGVPMTIKDSFDTKGVISSAGTLGRANYIPKNDATVVKRLKAAGAILLGKSNTPELTMAGSTDNLVYGRTNNPYDLNRSPGGSSGGAAAIVSAGGSAFDIGTDTGGSVRNPAHCCGVCGLRPTSGRVARTGHIIAYKGYEQALTTVGPITRYVEDLITILPIISGSDGIDPFIYDIALDDPYQIDIAQLKFAFYTDNGIVTPITDITKGLLAVVDEVSNTGASILEKRPKGIEQSAALWFGILGAANNYGLHQILSQAKTKELSPFLGFVDTTLDYTKPSISPKQFANVFESWASFNSDMTAFFTEYDIILCPVSSIVAHPHDFSDLANPGSYAMTYNLTGWPVVVVPVGTTSEGLPVGIQIVAKPWQEAKALAVAKFLEGKFGGFQPPNI